MYYKLAETPNDWAACHSLMVAQGEPDRELTTPTILAFDDEKLVGFIATTPNPGMVIGGPMIMRDHGGSPFTAARLAVLYQKVLRSMGVKWIIFHADEKTSPFGRGMVRMYPHIRPYAKKGSMMFYHWPLEPTLQRSA